MKKLFVFVIILIFVSNIKSQSFSSFINLINGNELGIELMNVDNGYYLLTGGICDPGTGNSKECTAILTLNDDKSIINNHIFVNWNRFAPNYSVQKVGDTIYVFGINQSVWGEKTSWNIYKTNSVGDSLDFFAYEGFDDVVIFPQSMQIKGDYIYLLGRHHNWYAAKGEYIVVLKIDKHGKKIKEERFANIAQHNLLPVSVDLVQTADGNFVLSGRNIDSKYDEYLQPYIIKFDEDLNLIWSKNLNRSSQFVENPSLAALKDGGVVVCNGIYTPDIIAQLGPEYMKYELYPATIYKFDKNSNMVWSDTLWTKIDHGWVGAQKRIVKMIEAHNGDIVGCGVYRDVDHKRWGWIFRYSPNGILKWNKKYEDIQYPDAKSVFYDIKEATNGDLICTGEMDSNEGWGNDDSYIWLLRVDSLGCFEPGCGTKDTVHLIYTTSDYITGTEEVIGDIGLQSGIIIYPNPASSDINVELSGENKVSKWDIFDIQGTKILSGTGANTEKINVSTVKSGMYYLQIIDNKGINVVGKFVVK